ncbi:MULTISPECIES: hypothetical protein [Niastella]|nr:hypothetical protein [Niastella soli]
MITTIAGGSIGDGKSATTVGIAFPYGIQVDSAENRIYLTM